MKKRTITIAALTSTLSLLASTGTAFALIDTVTPPDPPPLSEILDQAKSAGGIQGQLATAITDPTTLTNSDREAAGEAIRANPTVFHDIASLPAAAQQAILAKPELVRAASVFVVTARMEPSAQLVVSNMVANPGSALVLSQMPAERITLVSQTLSDPATARIVASFSPATANAIAAHVNIFQSTAGVSLVGSSPAICRNETVLTVLEQPQVARAFTSAPLATRAIDALASVRSSEGTRVIANLTPDGARRLVESANPAAVTAGASGGSQSLQASTNQTIARLDALQLEKVLAYYRRGNGPQGPAGPTSRANTRPEPGVWGSFIGGKADQDEINGAKGYEFDTRGVIFGYDRNLSPTLLIGINGGYTRTETTMDAGTSAFGTSKNKSISLYANQSLGALIHASYGLTLAGGDIDNTHMVNNDTVSSSTESHTYSLFGQVGYDYVQGKYILTPLFRAQASRNKTDGYTEHGSTLGLNAIVAGNTTNLFSTALGVNAVYFLDETISLKGRFRWSYEWSGELQPVTSSYFDGNSVPSFTESPGIDPGRNRFGLALGGKFDLAKSTSLDLDYEVELAQAFVSHTGVAKLKYQF